MYQLRIDWLLLEEEMMQLRERVMRTMKRHSTHYHKQNLEDFNEEIQTNEKKNDLRGTLR